MNDGLKLGPWVRRFLLEHVVAERNLAINTQRSYRDTLALLIPFVANKLHKSVDVLTISDLGADIVRTFLQQQEETKRWSTTTRNQRLAAVRAFARFVGQRSPENIDWCSQVRLVPFKRAARVQVTYLEKPEMDALLAAPDRGNSQGRRDHALLLFLYNTGSRADEAAQLKIADLMLAQVPQRESSAVRIRGKGNKIRHCPLWSQTVTELAPLVRDRAPSEAVFLNRCHRPITRFGIHTMVERYVRTVSLRFPSLSNKRVSPHSIRHTTATHLLRAGVDINTIRAWLGHVSIDTTNIYAEIDLERKAQALAHCEIKEAKPAKHWREDKGLMAFLKSL
jgi:site-specific recombinase XerD